MNMTNEEAILRILEHNMIHQAKEPQAICITEALNMAIKALQREPCTDAVSREAVLKSLCELGYGDEENGAEAEYMSALWDAANKVKELPPVTPEKGEWIPLKYRPLTEEERNQYGNEYDEFIDCEMPDENEEVLLTLTDGTVSTDIYCQAEDCTHYFENYDFNHIKAWMHKPEGYKEEESE